ncbi:hypothetical protein ARMSODRAFT_964639 [Armillaria solidipes]|uniref:Uncharacterized protein n=1 Tax=Armillaria solidipes TaxID=1076256 RepID=A0A2H3BDD8_9AGAR|nr:hypothetical protein ARMSODRAFT_964639 [Armillaria solidipes]
MSTAVESTTQPEAERIPRYRLQGGFLISPETALEWASKLENKPVTKINVAWQTIDLRVSRMGARFSIVGEEQFGQFMVVTQSKRFRRGYLGMDPSQIPQFREGEREAIARKMLEEELKDIHSPVVYATFLD